MYRSSVVSKPPFIFVYLFIIRYLLLIIKKPSISYGQVLQQLKLPIYTNTNPWALADSVVSGDGLTVSVDATVATRAGALEVPTRLLRATLSVGLTLVATAS